MKLKVMKPLPKVEQEKRAEVSKAWEQGLENFKITPAEIRRRVKLLRDKLETYQTYLEAAPFDIPCGDFEPPRSLGDTRREYIINIAEALTPRLDGLFHMIDDYCKQHGTHDLLDFNAQLFSLKTEYVQVGFKIGLLAGVIFSGASKDVVDSYERGLLFDLGLDGDIVKE
jgi:hypothetical protein